MVFEGAGVHLPEAEEVGVTLAPDFKLVVEQQFDEHRRVAADVSAVGIDLPLELGRQELFDLGEMLLVAGDAVATIEHLEEAKVLAPCFDIEQARESLAEAVEIVRDLADPVGKVTESWTRPNGMTIERVRVPIGVIGIIYESRPNVTADAGALALKAGNAVILREGGGLADIAPTLLEILGLPKPDRMSGQSLVMPISDELDRPQRVLAAHG